jgi:hypothetical protein
MREKMLSNKKFLIAVHLFLLSLWNSDPKKLASQGIGLGALLNFWRWNEEDDYEWRRTCLSIFQTPWSNQDISTKELIRITQALVSRYQNKYGFELSTTQRLLSEMENIPALYKTEYQLLQEAILAAESDRDWTPLFNYNFFDWAN